ncbi:MAG: M1 family metallopeptidase, partial [Phycisphaerae bacterium]|nr:M1 family metallopeptidase [Phycisphaerae bacterium]
MPFALVLCAVAIALSPAQRRQPPAPMPAVDATTGRDQRVYPPDRLVDYGHMKLELRFERLEDRSFTAKQTMTVRPIGVPVRGLRLDAPGLAISGVQDGDGKPIEWSHDGSSLYLHFAAPLGDAWTTLVTEYSCTDPIDGMTFTPAGPDATAYPAEVHTQGQPESNRFWFPCHD